MNIIEFISEGLFLPADEVRNYINTIPRRYKKFTIKKRNGGERLIAQPARTVKQLQKAIAGHYLQDKVMIHERAFAYVNGRGIKENAEAHKNNQYILKMDFKNFFLSIKPEMFIGVLEKQGIKVSDDDSFVIRNLFFWKLRRNSSLRLSIGAPTSPFISNVTMYFFDSEISDFCDGLNITYSRYADDLTFSSNQKKILFNIPIVVKKILSDVGLNSIKINKEKTVFSSKKFNRHVTGITLSNSDNLSLGRERKRLISSMIHHHKLEVLDIDEILKLKGYLGFAKHIEPSFIIRMKAKYGDEFITSIQKFNK